MLTEDPLFLESSNWTYSLHVCMHKTLSSPLNPNVSQRSEIPGITKSCFAQYILLNDSYQSKFSTISFLSHKALSLRIRMLVKLNSVLLFSMLCLPPILSPLTSQSCPLTGVLKGPVFVLVGQLSGLLMFLCLHNTARGATVVSSA